MSKIKETKIKGIVIGVNSIVKTLVIGWSQVRLLIEALRGILFPKFSLLFTEKYIIFNAFVISHHLGNRVKPPRFQNLRIWLSLICRQTQRKLKII